MRGITTYSNQVEGTKGNHQMAARFDKTDGFVGITSTDGKQHDRVLLSKCQVDELLRFLGAERKRKHKVVRR